MASGEGENINDDRLLAALVLRDAREAAERSVVVGERAPRIDDRVVVGEVAQARSFNKRVGGEPLPPEPVAARGISRMHALEREFVRRAHELRESSRAQPPCKRGRRRDRSADQATCPAHREVVWSAAGAEDVEATTCEASGDTVPPATIPPELWISKGLIVRVVDESGDFRASHRQKGSVRRVDTTTGTADVELAVGGDVLCAVPEAYLETVVSRSCCQVEVVRGEYRGAIAELLERVPQRNHAVVRLNCAFNKLELELRMDDVCAFT